MGTGVASVGHLQKAMKIGNGKAVRFLDKMEYLGLVSRDRTKFKSPYIVNKAGEEK